MGMACLLTYKSQHEEGRLETHQRKRLYAARNGCHRKCRPNHRPAHELTGYCIRGEKWIQSSPKVFLNDWMLLTTIIIILQQCMWFLCLSQRREKRKIAPTGFQCSGHLTVQTQWGSSPGRCLHSRPGRHITAEHPEFWGRKEAWKKKKVNKLKMLGTRVLPPFLQRLD